MKWYTNSEGVTYKRCKRQWMLRYWFKVAPPKRVSKTRDTGIVVHAVLADWYENPSASIDALIEYQIAQMKDLYPEEDHPEVDEVRRMTEAIVDGYLVWLEEEGPDSDLELIDTERIVWHQTPESNVGLLGRLDARFRRVSDEATFFMDHKVVQNLTDYPKWAHLDTQFKQYILLERLDRADEPAWTDGGIVNMLRRVLRTGRANPPFYGRFEVRHNDETMRRFWAQTYMLIHEIVRLEKQLNEGLLPERVPPSPSRDCSWQCPYFDVCPMMDSDEDWQEFMKVAYVETDPLERYQNG